MPGRVLFYIIALPLHATHSIRGNEDEYRRNDRAPICMYEMQGHGL